MTSVTFPFKVGTPKAGEKTIPLEDVEFRFTTLATRQLERSCGGNIDRVLGMGKSVEATVLLVCYGQRWNDADITEDIAAEQIDEFIEAGGNVVDLSVALYMALNNSGVYGKPLPEKKKRPTARGRKAPANASA